MDNTERQGIIAAIFAFGFWGVMPFYFRAFPGGVGAFEITLHRIGWTFVVLLAILGTTGDLTQAFRIFRNPRVIATLFLSTIFIAINWLIYAWAVMNQHLTEASLGYFINPLFNVALGVVFLREKLNIWRWLAVALAAIGVLNQIIIVGEPPWIALLLAFSFGIYGLLRKTVAAEAREGLFVETLLVAPLILGAIVWMEMHGSGHMVSGAISTKALLVTGGLTIAAPLTLFAYAARRIPLSTLGLIQYIAPSAQFGLAIYFGETLSLGALITFGFIWAGLALYTFDLWRKRGTVHVS